VGQASGVGKAGPGKRSLENGAWRVGQSEMGRKRGSGAIAGWGWLVVATVVGACAQTPGNGTAASDIVRAVAAAPQTVLVPQAEVLRQIEDPSTGDLWLLLRDQDRPGGPGRLVLSRQRLNMQKAMSGGSAQPSSAEQRPVIRAGDALAVEEHTALVDVRLEAVALESAAKGAHFKARLEIGGKVVRVVAISPGRAEFAPESEVEP